MSSQAPSYRGYRFPSEIRLYHRFSLSFRDAEDLPGATRDHGHLRDCDPSLGEEIFDISQTQAETVIQPDSMADDLGWKAVAAVAESSGLHLPYSLSRPSI